MISRRILPIVVGFLFALAGLGPHIGTHGNDDGTCEAAHGCTL